MKSSVFAEWQHRSSQGFEISDRFYLSFVIFLSQDGEILIGKLHLDTKLSWDVLSDMATDHFKVTTD